MLQSFVGSDRYLRGQAFTVDKPGGVDDGREPGIEEDLAAVNHKTFDIAWDRLPGL
jgi:hypothetical protein